MEEIINLIVGIIFLILGFPLGNFLAKLTKDELKSGQKWFKLIILASLVGALISLAFGNDYLLFTFLFALIVTSRSLIVKTNKKVK